MQHVCKISIKAKRVHTDDEGGDVDGVEEVRQQRPLHAQHVPAADLVAARHDAEPLLAVGARRHREVRGDGALAYRDKCREIYNSPTICWSFMISI